MQTWLILALALSFLAGCGGGGGGNGKCVFGPSECSYGSGSTSTAGSGSSSGSASGFSQSGTGDSTFVIPLNVSVLRIQAQFPGSVSTFFVDVAGRSLVVETIGTSRNPSSFDGTYVVTPGALVEITNSNGVSWTATAVQVDSASNAGLFSRSGTGDAVFILPARASRYRIQAMYPGSIQTFFVDSSGSSLVIATIGTSRTPARFDGTYALPGGSRIEITRSSGVLWSFIETP